VTDPTPDQTFYPGEPRPLSKDQIKALTGTLSQTRVAKRQGSGGSGQLSYLEAWDVKASLARVFGFGGFSAETIDTRYEIRSAVTGTNAKGAETFQHTAIAMCTVRLTIHQTGAVYTESAASSQVNPQAGEALDFAIKSAESDALKRAATYLGTQFGLSLYNNGSLGNVIDVILAPDQKDIWDEIKAERAGANPAGRALVDRALAQAARADDGDAGPEGS
jgi:recombination DNA repair RAD52 pathway protein